MNRVLIILFATFALILGALAFLQHADLALLRDQIATLKNERDAARKGEADAKAAADAAKLDVATEKENSTRLKLARDDAEKRAKSAAPAAQPAAASDTAAKSDLGGFAKMFQTEEGRKMMRSQAAMQGKMMYGGLAKELKLDPKTADTVMQLLADRQGAMMDAGFDMMGKEGVDPKESAAKMEAMQADWDAKLRATLGDEGFAQMKDYERTLGDRMMMTMHDQSFNAAGVPLESAQRDSLMKVLTEERKKTPPNVFDGGGAAQPGKAFAAMNDDGAIDQWMKSEEDFQRRVLQSATKVLNPDQINALGGAFKQQAEMQKFGMKMGREMFKGNATPAAPPTPVEAPAPK